MGAKKKERLPDDYHIKFLLIGNKNVGKTAIQMKYFDGEFQEHMLGTIGVDNRINRLDLKGYRVKMQVFDTGGQDNFNVAKNYF